MPWVQTDQLRRLQTIWAMQTQRLSVRCSSDTLAGPQTSIEGASVRSSERWSPPPAESRQASKLLGQPFSWPRQWPFGSMDHPEGVNHRRSTVNHLNCVLPSEGFTGVSRNDSESQPERYRLKDERNLIGEAVYRTVSYTHLTLPTIYSV